MSEILVEPFAGKVCLIDADTGKTLAELTPSESADLRWAMLQAQRDLEWDRPADICDGSRWVVAG